MSTNRKLPHKERLRRLAEVVIKIGLNPSPGQQLYLTSPIEAIDFARLLTAEAYRAGVSLVTPFFRDDAMTLARYQHARDDSFDVHADWLFGGVAHGFGQANVARLGILGDNPNLLADCDPEKVRRVEQAYSKAYYPAMKHITDMTINWTLMAAATPTWAKAVFPHLSERQAMNALWDAIFKVTRVDCEDPVAAWQDHNRALKVRADYMNARHFKSLHFWGPGTNLLVGLPDGHIWCSGATKAKNGIIATCNMPTEEIWTTPDRMHVSGQVTSTKPLILNGVRVENIFVRFEDGVAVEARASKGEHALKSLLSSDDASNRLGEVALVPHSSPISQSGIVFLETLFDENAACHIAFGEAYTECMAGGHAMSPEELVANGSNISSVHEDWMIGSDKLTVDGIAKGDVRVPLMRNGEWTKEVTSYGGV